MKKYFKLKIPSLILNPTILFFIFLSAGILLGATPALGECNCSTGAFGSSWTTTDPCFADSDCSLPCERTVPGGVTPTSLSYTCATTSVPSGGTTTPGAPEKIKLENPLGGGTGVTSVPLLIGNIIKTILMIVGALALAMFVYGGFTWLTSGGSADKVKKGKDILIWATIGLIVIFTSYTLVDFLLTALGI
ncbi:hypothetical protein HZB93_04200 [Candidatus Falkowbacteria bacterium]|nr:hypothetical protein [Candidatus Falkowbacteria bacterium]